MIWIDGYNLFYRWSATTDLFASNLRDDATLPHRLELACKRLSTALGKKRKMTLLFLDGGQQTGFGTHFGLRVSYAGPGKKADNQLIEALQGKREKVTVVTDDRALAASLRADGGRIQSVEKFVKTLGSTKRKSKDEAYKQQDMSPQDVEAWLEFFEEE